MKQSCAALITAGGIVIIAITSTMPHPTQIGSIFIAVTSIPQTSTDVLQ